MGGGHFTVSTKERDHLGVCVRIKAGGLVDAAAAAGPHRQWRERRRQFGDLVQMDGSHHCWFEGACPVMTLTGACPVMTLNGDPKRYCLMVMIDDAAGRRPVSIVS